MLASYTMPPKKSLPELCVPTVRIDVCCPSTPCLLKSPCLVSACPPSGLMRPGLLYRAALEGVTLSLLAGLRRMEALGVRPQELRLVGGGAANLLWRQVIADAFQLPIW